MAELKLSEECSDKIGAPSVMCIPQSVLTFIDKPALVREDYARGTIAPSSISSHVQVLIATSWNDKERVEKVSEVDPREETLTYEKKSSHKVMVGVD